MLYVKSSTKPVIKGDSRLPGSEQSYKPTGCVLLLFVTPLTVCSGYISYLVWRRAAAWTPHNRKNPDKKVNSQLLSLRVLTLENEGWQSECRALSQSVGRRKTDKNAMQSRPNWKTSGHPAHYNYSWRPHQHGGYRPGNADGKDLTKMVVTKTQSSCQCILIFPPS